MTAARKITLLVGCLLLGACTKAQDSTSQALDTAGTETSASYDKMRNYLDVGHKPKPVPVKGAQPRYCYHTYEDIICYSKPLPGEEYRLVGFQNSAGKTGYTLPQETAPEDADPLPPLKSLDVGPPPAIKADTAPQLKEIIFDPAELQPKELVPDKMQ